MPSLARSLPLAAGAAVSAVAGSRWALGHPVFGGTPVGDRLARMAASPQWRGPAASGRFVNAEASGMGGSPQSVWEFVAGNRALRRPSAPVPTMPRTAADFATPQRLRATWLGHGSSLVEIAGRRFALDPVLSRYASPFPMPMLARFADAPITAETLPPLDAVVLTHDHYDHLDYATVRHLAPVVPRWIAPLGVGAHLERWGVAPERITELDWWEETAVGTLGEAGHVRLVATPARHFSGRGLADRNRTLWCGWAFVAADARLYATGDGGMQRAFAEVGERLGPFNLTLAESGAYNAAWADIHMGPEQAVAATVAARGGLLVPVHWGTFNLSLHGWTEPAERVLVAAAAAGVPLAVPRPGESVDPFAPPAVERWWPEQAWQTADEAPVVSSGW